MNGISSVRLGGRTAWGCAGRSALLWLLPLILPGWAGAQTLDSSFNPGANYAVYALAVQPDGLILAGGQFTALGGKACGYLGRLNSDGSVNPAFSPGADGYVNALALQPDGKIIIGGAFTSLGGRPRNYIGRVNADGTLDTNFVAGANGAVVAMALQPDGKILVGGAFTTLNEQTVGRLGRLNADGTLDTSFDPGAGANDLVNCLALQPDGKILAGGKFSTLADQTRNFIARLNADGSLDSSFNLGANGFVNCLLVQPDGKILVGGGFTSLNSQAYAYLGRLSSAGTLDTAFYPRIGGTVNCMVLQADGKVVVGGQFSTVGLVWQSYLGRLKTDGSLDTNFTKTAGSAVDSLALQANGAVVVGGEFGTLAGQSRNHIGRLISTDLATQSLSSDASSITWLRGGTSPEVWCTRFDLSTNGTDWLELGAGTLISGGWQLSGLILPSSGTIRARGALAGGYHGSSTGWMEAFAGSPVIVTEPLSQLAPIGQTVAFTVTAAGTGPFGYQWRKNGAVLSAMTTNSLLLTNVQLADATSYDIVVTNSLGSITSAPAQLNIITSPASADSWSPVPYYTVYSMVVQADGKVLVGGSFTNLAGQARTRLGRFNVDGNVDSTFNPGADGPVYCLAVQTNGAIVVGGSFTNLAGQGRSNTGRLNPDGSLDSSFNPGADGGVYSFAIQPDGKILVGGSFTNLAGQARSYIGRLNPGGSLDDAFNPGAGDAVDSFAVQSDGGIVVAGYFTNLAGAPRNYIGRLSASGSLDTSFNPWANRSVASLSVQADGKILVGGYFTTLGGQSRSGIGRLNADGTVDSDFNPAAISASPSLPQVGPLAVQADGKILVGGSFAMLGGQPRTNIARLNPDGTADPSFNPGANAFVYALVVQPDGKVLVGGYFSVLGGQPRSRLGRLNNTDPASQSLTFNGASVTWLRGGTSPEVWFASFDYSTNGTDWINLGAGERISNGWRLTGISVPTSAVIRAVGLVVSDDSSWLLETVIPQSRPVILMDDATCGFHTNYFGFNVSGSAGETVVVEYSSNFMNWTGLGTNLLGAGPAHFSDPGAANCSARFYRARLQ
jgi:uncharacterized delta-60 repeat protein